MSFRNWPNWLQNWLKVVSQASQRESMTCALAFTRQPHKGGVGARLVGLGIYGSWVGVPGGAAGRGFGCWWSDSGLRRAAVIEQWD